MFHASLSVCLEGTTTSNLLDWGPLTSAKMIAVSPRAATLGPEDWTALGILLVTIAFGSLFSGSLQPFINSYHLSTPTSFSLPWTLWST